MISSDLFGLRVVWAVTVVGLAAMLAAVCLRRASAASRHRVWGLSLAASLVVPLAVAIAPELRIGWIELRRVGVEPSRAMAASPGAVNSSPSLVLQRESREITRESATTSQSPSSETRQSSPSRRAAVAPAPASADANPAPRALEAPQLITSVDAAAMSPTGQAFLVWCLPAVVLLGLVALSIFRARRVVRRATIVDNEHCVAILRQLLRGQGPGGGVTLRQCTGVVSPFCVGSTILLPGGWRAWPRDELRAILAHELAHVVRRDVAWQLLARVACAIYWFHPLVWLAAWRMRAERERACGGWALAAGCSAVSYARVLLNVAAQLSLARQPPPTAAVAMACGRRFERRIRAILAPGPHGGLSRAAARRLGLTMLAVFLTAAVVSPFRPSQAESPGEGSESKTAESGDEWRFVLPAPGEEHEYPPLRVMGLASEKPEDIKETAEYRGSSRRYAQMRYGSPNAARVAIVVDQVAPGDVDLYVDTNRTIEPRERCAGEGGVWRVALDVPYAQGEAFDVFPRELVFRLGKTGRTLSFAAAGYWEGKTALGESEGEPVAIRRMDGDGNGFFTDPQDRLWFDLNGDGRWDPVDEQYLYATMLTIAGQRYALRSDERGTRLALAKLEGTGTIQLAVRQKSSPTSSEPGVLGRIVEMAVTLVGRDGSALGLHGAGAEVKAPIGEYRVTAVAVSFDDVAGGPRWNFVFSDDEKAEKQHWLQLEKDAKLAIDPLEKLELSTGPWEVDLKYRPGQDLTFEPKLYTINGLRINTCYRGTYDTGRDGTAATITLTASDGTVLAKAQTGFG